MNKIKKKKKNSSTVLLIHHSLIPVLSVQQSSPTPPVLNLFVRPATFTSATVERRLVVFGRPRLRFPWSVHRVTLSAGFLSVCPSQRHLRLLIQLLVSQPIVPPHSKDLTEAAVHKDLYLGHRWLQHSPCFTAV